MEEPKELAVHIVTNSEYKCAGCGETLYPGNWFMPAGSNGVLCLTCADLDYLTFLPSGDAALTRRACKYSKLVVIVLRWSRARKRHERQGVLVEAEAIEKAESECLADSDARARRREREAIRRAALDQDYVRSFAARVREVFPSCPAGVETIIAEHACEKYSGRVGRSAAAKRLDEEMVRLAVVAYVRHTGTNYDELLAQNYPRELAREQVRNAIDTILAKWEANGSR